jgi:site-specific DNA-cytosine methylase
LLWSGSDQPNAERLIDKAGTLTCNQGQRGGFICPAEEKGLKPYTASSFGNYAPGVDTLRAQRQGDETLLTGPVIPINTENMSPGSTSFGNTVGNPGDPQFSITASHCHGVAHPTAFRKAKRAQTEEDDETWVDDDKTNTLNNFDIGDTRSTVAIVEPNQVSPTLTARMQGSSGWAPYNETAHILPVAFTQNQREEVREQTRATVAVVEPKLYENNGSDARVKGPLDVAPTVIARYGTGGNNMPLVQEGCSDQTPNVDVSGTLRANPGSGFRSDGSPVEPVVIVNNKPQGVDLYNQTLTGDLAVPLRTAQGHGAPAVYDMKQHHNPQPTGNVQLTTKNCSTIRGDTPLAQDHLMAVRRLTPAECMRLQGFPDDHARIPWKNKPAEECPDGPQYKCAGNSFSVNVVRWIGTQIAKKEASRNE